MSKNLNEIYVANPVTTIGNTDLMYVVTTGTTDAAINGLNLKALFAPAAGSTSIVTLGTITTGTWNATVITGTYGGTGVNNGARTITIGGNVTFSGGFTFTGTITGNTSVTFPTSGTLATTAQIPTGAALTRVDDTNVTLTLGGSPSTALVNAASITAGWSGQLGLIRGGTAASLVASNGGIVYSDASAMAILAGTATANLPLLSGSSSAPSWGAFALSLGGAVSTAGALTLSGAFAATFTFTNTTSVTFPTSGTLATTAQIPTGAALTKADDTNVTLTLGGSPTTALVNAASITAGWTGQLAVGRGGTGVASVTTSPTASAFAGWDANSNLSANSFITGYATTATAAGTTTLTVASKQQQYFTGSTTQTVLMPVTSTLVLGQTYQIVNLSSGVVTVQSSGANTIQAMAANSVLNLTCILTSGTGTASWNASYGTLTAAAVAGSTRQVQFNNSGAFAANAGFTYDTTKNNSFIGAGAYSVNAAAQNSVGLSGAAYLGGSYGLAVGNGATIGNGSTGAVAFNWNGNANSGDYSFTFGQNSANSGNRNFCVGKDVSGQSGTDNIYLGANSTSSGGANYAVAIGRYSAPAHTGVMALSDSVNSNKASTAVDQLMCTFAGGQYFYKDSTTLVAQFLSTGCSLKGTTTNDSATALYVGEYISGQVAAASAVSNSNNTARDITSISLTAGDWDVGGNAFFTIGGTCTVIAAWVSSTSATAPDASLLAYLSNNAAVNNSGITVPCVRISVASTTTVYLSSLATFSTSTVTSCGFIWARRAR